MIGSVCEACKCFKSEALVPVGERAAELCWLCAHQVADHDESLQGAASALCSCAAEQVYPAAVRAETLRKMATAPCPFVWRGELRRG